MTQSPSSSPPAECSCERPLPRAKAERKGAAQTRCERCGKPVPLSLRP